MFGKTLVVKAVVVAASAVAGPGAAVAARSPAPHQTSAVSIKTQPAVSDSSGNLQVTVPATPSQSSLRGLCEQFLALPRSVGRTSEHMSLLIGATGGSTTKTTHWCRQYLAPDYGQRAGLLKR